MNSEIFCEICGELFLARNGIEVCHECLANYLKVLKNKKLGFDSRWALRYARTFGASPLNGTIGQRNWAECIRATKLRYMNDDQAKLACDPHGLLRHSKFWIAHRKTTPKDIGYFVTRQKSMLAEHRQAIQQGELVYAQKIADEYDALTTEWFRDVKNPHDLD